MSKAALSRLIPFNRQTSLAQRTSLGVLASIQQS
jgi:hypothetical protein